MGKWADKLAEAGSLVYALVAFWLLSEVLPPLRLAGVSDSILDEVLGLAVATALPLLTVGRGQVHVEWNIAGDEHPPEVYQADLRVAPVPFVLDARPIASTLLGYICLRLALARGAQVIITCKPSDALRLIEQGSTRGARISRSEGRIYVPLDAPSGVQDARASGSLASGAYGLERDTVEIEANLHLRGRAKRWWWIRVRSSVTSVRTRSTS